MAGLFFCLASAEGAGLLFFPCYNTTPYKRLQWLLYHMCNYTAHAIKQRTRLYRRFSSDLPHSNAANNRPTQAAIIPPVDRWQALTHAASSTDPAHLLMGQRLHLYRVSPAASRYCPRPAACDLAPGQPGTLHPAGQSSGRGAAGGAEPLTAAAVFLFGLSPDS